MFGIQTDEWVHFTSKPFSLFAVSLWDHCYSEYMSLITKGVPALKDTIFIQNKNGVVRNYRKKKDLELIKHTLLEIYRSDTDFIKQKLVDADDAIEEGRKILDAAAAHKSVDLPQAIDIVCRIAILGSVLPRFLSQALVGAQIFDNEILDGCIELKKISLYPRIISEIIEPQISTRMQSWSNDIRKYFVYISENGQIDTLWTDQPGSFVEKIEGRTDVPEINMIKGISVFPGIVQGKARVCLTMNGADIDLFDEGDILVTNDSNPNLGHLIQKAGGLIVEESTFYNDSDLISFDKSENCASHAAILSKEHGIPCIMNVKNATLLIKGGTLIEIDGISGSIRLLK